MKEEIKKMFRRIELDKSNDSCGFEFADGFSCTFDNIATCYDDRLKLYDLVKDLQSQLKAKEEVVTKLKEWLEETLNELKQNDVYDRNSYETGQIIATECIIAKIEDLEILSKGENK